MPLLLVIYDSIGVEMEGVVIENWFGIDLRLILC